MCLHCELFFLHSKRTREEETRGGETRGGAETRTPEEDHGQDQRRGDQRRSRGQDTRRRPRTGPEKGSSDIGPEPQQQHAQRTKERNVVSKCVNIKTAMPWKASSSLNLSTLHFITFLILINKNSTIIIAF